MAYSGCSDRFIRSTLWFMVYGNEEDYLSSKVSTNQWSLPVTVWEKYTCTAGDGTFNQWLSNCIRMKECTDGPWRTVRDMWDLCRLKTLWAKLFFKHSSIVNYLGYSVCWTCLLVNTPCKWRVFFLSIGFLYKCVDI